MKRTLSLLVLMPLCATWLACQVNRDSSSAAPAGGPADCDCEQTVEGRVEEVLTAEQQAALTPERALRILEKGNERFVSNDLTARDHSTQVRKSTVMRELEERGDIDIVGAIYDMDIGEVTFQRS